MKWKSWLKLIRWKNLLMLFLVHLLIKFSLFPKFHLLENLDALHFILFSVSVILIMAAGYIVNDLYDVEADKINKPDKVFVGEAISKVGAKRGWYGLNFIGICLGTYISIYIGKPIYALIFLAVVLALWAYAKVLKKQFIWGNLLISALIFLSISMVPIFDLNLPNPENLVVKTIVFKIAMFSLILTLLREVTKDAEDLRGDRIIQARTFPIKWGLQKTNSLLMGITGITTLLVFWFALDFFKTNLLLFWYLILGVLVPLLYFAIKVKGNRSHADYHRSSKLLKMIMLLGILTLIFI